MAHCLSSCSYQCPSLPQLTPMRQGTLRDPAISHLHSFQIACLSVKFLNLFVNLCVSLSTK